jgi:pimeloyl-ACP methyl ester carboxylesterase
MDGPGIDAVCDVSDGRVIEYWDGGDPEGRPVLFHPGTPASRLLGRWGHEPARAAGVRLISVSRPGYGGSTPVRAPGLVATGRDTAALARSLGLDDYAVLGISGGAPFAMATAIVDVDAVRVLALVAGIGPWRLLDPPEEAQAKREQLGLLDAGDLPAAAAGLRRLAEAELGDLRAMDDEARVDAFLDEGPGTPPSPLANDAGYRALWAANISVVLNGLDGYLHDDLAFGAAWDADPADVATPTLVWDADGSGGVYGRWYAERITGSVLTTYPGEGHLDVCDSHWPALLAAVLRTWG